MLRMFCERLFPQLFGCHGNQGATSVAFCVFDNSRIAERAQEKCSSFFVRVKKITVSSFCELVDQEDKNTRVF